MIKVTEQNNNLKQGIIISTVLHIILFIFLVWKPFNKYIKTSKNITDQSANNTITINSKLLEKNYNRQQYQKTNKKLYEKQDDKEKFKKEQLHVQDMLHGHVQQTKKNRENIETNFYQKQINSYKENIPLKIKSKTASLHKKKKKEKIKKRLDKIGKIPVIEDIDDLLNKLSSNDSTLKKNSFIKKNKFLFKKNNQKNKKVYDTEIKNYAKQIKKAIENNLHDLSSYNGKVCTIKIKLSSDGIFTDIHSKEGDPALCSLALLATRQAKAPKPSSQLIYEIFKDILLEFKP